MVPPAAELIVLDRGSDDPALVERAYRAVLAPSFTPDEIPPYEELLSDVAGSTVVVAVQGDEPVAAAISDAGTSSPVALLGYLAVRPDQRGTGIGSLLMSRLHALWGEGTAEVVLGEVHDPRCWPASEDERPADRLRFYERAGARLLAAPWVQPRLRGDGERVPGMLLLVMWARAGRASVPAAWVRDWTAAYYLLAEGLARPADDPVVARLVRRMEATDPIPIGAIGDHGDVPLLDPPPPGR